MEVITPRPSHYPSPKATLILNPLLLALTIIAFFPSSSSHPHPHPNLISTLTTSPIPPHILNHPNPNPTLTPPSPHPHSTPPPIPSILHPHHPSHPKKPNILPNFVSVPRWMKTANECKNALEVMDSEMPRTEASIGNRSQLAKEVHIEKIMRKNKDATEPYRSMIEVIVKFLIERGSNSKDNSERVPEQRSSTDLSSPEKKSSPEKRSSQSSSRGKQKEKSEQKQQRVKSPKDKDTSPTDYIQNLG
eukprot:XP_011662169.1 PREDICTED: sporozoite surface protein 2-like [Strongylocentrotus purpuratus]